VPTFDDASDPEDTDATADEFVDAGAENSDAVTDVGEVVSPAGDEEVPEAPVDIIDDDFYRCQVPIPPAPWERTKTSCGTQEREGVEKVF